MQFIKLISLSKSQKEQVLALWNNEYPTSITHKDLKSFDGYLGKLDMVNHIIVVNQEQLIAWYCDFEREGAKNFAMIIDRNFQGKGLGSNLLNMAKAGNLELNGWVVIGDKFKRQDGSAYPSPVEFYEKNGFEILYDQTWETDLLKTVKIRWAKDLM